MHLEILWLRLALRNHGLILGVDSPCIRKAGLRCGRKSSIHRQYAMSMAYLGFARHIDRR